MNGQTERGKYDAILHELCANGWRNDSIPAGNKDVRIRVQAAFDSQDMEIASQASEIRLLKAQAEKDEGLMSAQAKAIDALDRKLTSQAALILLMREALGAAYEANVHDHGCSQGKYCTCFQCEVEAALNPAEPGTSDASSPR